MKDVLKDGKLIPANVAREYVEVSRLANDAKNLNYVTSLVNMAIEKGEMKVCIYEKPTTNTIKALERAGYNVSESSFKNEYQCTIRWDLL
ncbi:hypothetical protein [Spirosoma profusum]|uniref:hypothetical protein n=1 Tax=Spirosoma profusum TaxID=2771354 RepID=UPI001682F467|nr:hypothetical protein [Spirosoma profusum]